MFQNSKLEIAWSAGFFDGEGTTFSSGRSLQLSVGQVNRDNLARFMSAVGGAGNVIHGRRISVFQAYGEKARAIVCLLWPFLGDEKRDQAITALLNYSMRTVAPWRGGQTCARGHRFAEVGYTSRRECRSCRKDRVSGTLRPIQKHRAIELGIGMRTYHPEVET